jgi:hypothetical protein
LRHFRYWGGGKIEHSNIYDLWFLIYDLQFGHKGTTKKRDTQEKKKKNRGGHAVNSTEVRAMMREKCTEKGRHSMPGNIRKNLQKKGAKEKICIIGTHFVLYLLKTNAYETDFFSFDGFDAVCRHDECMY